MNDDIDQLRPAINNRAIRMLSRSLDLVRERDDGIKADRTFWDDNPDVADSEYIALAEAALALASRPHTFRSTSG